MATYSNGKSDNIDLTPSARTVLEGRYLKKDETGKLSETAEGMFRRVAHTIAQPESNYGGNVEETEEQFFDLMSSLRFLPNSPTLMNAGKDNGLGYSACYVLPIVDSIEGIFEAAKQGAMVHKSGGGTGYSFSRLRPKGDLVRSSKGVASGPVSFMYAYNVYTEAVKQGGTRRGANMGILNIDHPDIMEFIDAKTHADEKVKEISGMFSDLPYVQKMIEAVLIEKYQLDNFNISVGVTDKFMEAFEAGQDYNLIHPNRNGKVVGKLNARKVMERITENAWKRGDPGVVFIDRINRYNPTHPDYFKGEGELPRGVGLMESTNPCGEQPLLPHESCNLGSIDLSRHIKDGKFDYSELERTVRTSIHELDNVIECNVYPISEIAETTKSNRKIGLGVMGWQDALILLGQPYGSKESLATADEVMSFISKVSKQKSAELAKERGSFPNIEHSMYRGQDMRNATTTTIAPTGTISIIAGCSSGIEPLFAIAYRRSTPQFKGLSELFETNRIFEQIAKEKGIYSKDLLEEICNRGGTLKGYDKIPQEIKDLFVTAHELSPETHIKMQSAFQKGTDNAVSKTINLSNNATKEDVFKAYVLAYQLGLKGITVFRDGCRNQQVLTTGGKNPQKKSLLTIVVEEAMNAKRPERIEGETISMDTTYGKVFVTINQDVVTGRPYELFVTIGKTGSDMAGMAEAIGREGSLSLKTGHTLDTIASQLAGIGGKGTNIIVSSLPDAIAKAIKIRIAHLSGEEPKEDASSHKSEYVEENHTPKIKKISGNVCPNCHSPTLIMGEGCEKCSNCGYDKCQ